MRAALKRGVCLALLWLPAAAAGDALNVGDGGGQPLACIGQQTFYPRGNKWATNPSSSVVVRAQADGPPQSGAIAIPATVANTAVVSAFGIWAQTICAAPDIRADIKFTWGADYPTRDNGDDPVAGTYTNVVWWVSESANWQADTATTAVVNSDFFADTGVTLNADIAFNGVNFNWRAADGGTGSQYGCNASDANCYDIKSVALHAVGHFVGLNHISCANSVMQPSLANVNTLNAISVHDKAGLCAVYPPHSGSARSLGENCGKTADCASHLTCLLPASNPAATAYGICAQDCSSSTDCPIGYLCYTLDARGNYCQPGVHLAGIAPQVVAPIADLCRPCTTGDICLSQTCGLLGKSGICTQQCKAPSYGCPQGFACANIVDNLGICWPNDAANCQWPGPGADQVCAAPAAGSAPAVQEACRQGYTCFPFVSGTSFCEQACSAVDPTQVCDAGLQCCFGTDASGHCIISRSGQADGACFKIRHVGDSCANPADSMCDGTTACMYLEDATRAKCYHTCASGTCPTSAEVCTTLPNLTPPLCCQKSTFNPNDPASCVPAPGPCARQLGVSCDVNGDCDSGICLKYKGGAACSAACSTDADCPSSTADANGDGLTDGGGACVSVGTRTMCWPQQGPIAPPACATVAGADKTASGCGCRTTPGHALSTLAALYLVPRLRRRFKQKLREGGQMFG